MTAHIINTLNFSWEPINIVITTKSALLYFMAADL